MNFFILNYKIDTIYLGCIYTNVIVKYYE